MTILLTSLRELEPVAVEKLSGSPRDVILYRGYTKDGNHSEEYCVEYQFPNKRAALAHLRRSRQTFREIEDHQDLPWR